MENHHFAIKRCKDRYLFFIPQRLRAECHADSCSLPAAWFPCGGSDGQEAAHPRPADEVNVEHVELPISDEHGLEPLAERGVFHAEQFLAIERMHGLGQQPSSFPMLAHHIFFLDGGDEADTDA